MRIDKSALTLLAVVKFCDVLMAVHLTQYRTVLCFDANHSKSISAVCIGQIKNLLETYTPNLWQVALAVRTAGVQIALCASSNNGIAGPSERRSGG